MSAETSPSGPIVVGTDGSEGATKAVREAARLALALGVELHLVSAGGLVSGAHIVGAPVAAAEIWQPLPDQELNQILSSAAVEVRHDGLVVAQHTADGDPADALINIADEVDAQLIVVGSRGMHGIQRVLGSVPNKVSHAAHRNVLIVATS
jgi:nucleotide-binding universal stress UspA family protein